MKFSIISVLVSCLFLSCAIPTVKNLPEYNLAITQFQNPFFANVDTDYVYKAKINAFDNSFGGILIFKKIKGNNHRIVFTTNFGNKIFDFELINNTFKIHFIIEELNRSIIINTLKRDFETLTHEENKIQKAFKDQKTDVFQSKSNKKYNHYIVNSQTQELIEIIHTTKHKVKTIMTFNDVENNIAKTIKIQHENAPITIDLVYLNNN